MAALRCERGARRVLTTALMVLSKEGLAVCSCLLCRHRGAGAPEYYYAGRTCLGAGNAPAFLCLGPLQNSCGNRGHPAGTLGRHRVSLPGNGIGLFCRFIHFDAPLGRHLRGAPRALCSPNIRDDPQYDGTVPFCVPPAYPGHVPGAKEQDHQALFSICRTGLDRLEE